MTAAKEVVVEGLLTVILTGWLLFLVIVIVGLSWFFYAYRRFWIPTPRPERCPACHRPQALVRTPTMMTPANIARTDRRGEPLGSFETEREPYGAHSLVPDHLEVFRCRYCGHQEVLERPIIINNA
jgi:hypothetical protein